VDGSTSSKVETTHLEGPPSRIPGPAGDRVIDNGSPDEDEDDTGTQTGAVHGCTDSQSWGNGREHALVNSEEQVWNLCAPDGRLSKDVSETNVLKIADIGSRGVGEGQGVAPEEPLKAHNGSGHH
jgi:hypothetical protein